MTAPTAEAFASLDRSLSNVKPTEAGIAEIESLRFAAKAFGFVILAQPPSRERSLAITKLEEAVMWAVKGVVLAAPVPATGF